MRNECPGLIGICGTRLRAGCHVLRKRKWDKMRWRQGDEGMKDWSEWSEGFAKSACPVDESEKMRHGFRVTEQTGTWRILDVPWLNAFCNVSPYVQYLLEIAVRDVAWTQMSCIYKYRAGLTNSVPRCVYLSYYLWDVRVGWTRISYWDSMQSRCLNDDMMHICGSYLRIEEGAEGNVSYK